MGSSGRSSNGAEPQKVENKLLLTLAMVSFGLFAVAEVVAATVANSESLLADALTMMVDGISYGINLWAEQAKVGKSERSQLMIDTVAPTVSVVLLLAITIYVLIGAVDDLKHPDDTDVNATVMWVFASVNLVLDFANIAMFYLIVDPETGKWRLSCERGICCRGDEDTEEESNLNMMSALAHVAADTLRSVAVMFAGIFAAISAKDDTQQADNIGAIVVSVAIAGSVVPLCFSIFNNLLELYSGDGYSLVDTDPKLELLDVFGSDVDDDEDEEEVVPWRAST